jgi:exodeoxyribonuclease-3
VTVQTSDDGSLPGVRLATWNVNSALVRLPRLLPWLDERAPDVVCLQETKLTDEQFAENFDGPLAERGYRVAHVGEGRWNGVALLSKVGLDDVERALPDVPSFNDKVEARAVTATCGGLRVTSVYVPNGRSPGDPHYAYKLEWLAALRAAVSKPGSAVVAGDMNIAATDADVWNPALFTESTHVTPPERKALADLIGVGLHDVVRDRWPDEPHLYSYWDYQKGRFHQDQGMRIDLVLAGDDPAGRVAAAWVDRQARKGKGPSDHAPVIVDLDTAPDGDIGPVVPPPSNPKRT